MRYLFTIIAFIIAGHSMAQNYIPFPVSSGYWQYYSTYSDMGLNTKCSLSLYATHDTCMRNGNTYYWVNYFGSHWAALREENKVVYFYKDGFGELVAFNFNVSVGDAMPIVFSGRYFQSTPLGQEFQQSSAVVTSIGTINVGNVLRKQYFFGGPDSYAIEGIGGSFGLFSITPHYLEMTLEFICANDGYGFIHPGGQSCDYPFPTSVSEQKKSNEFSAYPNPCNDELNIESVMAGNVQVYSMLGRLVYTGVIAQGMHTIYLSGNAPGTYIIYLKDVNGRLLARQTIIKQ